MKFLFPEMFNQAVCPKDACFHSVPCQIVNGVPQCGPCPPDYIGDGRYCDKNVPTCVNNSCFGGEKIYSLKFLYIFENTVKINLISFQAKVPTRKQNINKVSKRVR